jgi:hypothetical protein
LFDRREDRPASHPQGDHITLHTDATPNPCQFCDV